MLLVSFSFLLYFVFATEMTINSSTVSIGFRGCTFHDGCKQGIDQQIFNRKWISRKITHLQSYSNRILGLCSFFTAVYRL